MSATAHMSRESPRAADWLAVFGSLDVPIYAPIPSAGSDPDHAAGFYYFVRVLDLSPEVRERAIDHVVRRFGERVGVTRETVAEIFRDNPTRALPLFSADVSVSSTDMFFL